jgi:4-amino-4-deoxy-L-arabinose transferase-like glycosyltransferase
MHFLTSASNHEMRRTDWIALTLSLLAVVAAYLVADRIFERLPHLEDEWAYIWQAQVAAQGQLSIPSPEHPQSILVPFVVDYNGLRFGKYPPAWPVVLAFGERFNARAWINPLLAGLGIWLTYRLGQKVFNSRIGLLAAFLTLASPFFLINSGTLLSHPLSYVLSAVFALAWMDTFFSRSEESHSPLIPKWITISTAGLALGLLALTRPLTGIGVALPFFIHGVVILLRGRRADKVRVVGIGSITLGVALLLFAWQHAVTGNPFLNPYTLWWNYDRLGFGPGIGTAASGHSLRHAWDNVKLSLNAGWRDLFGWGSISWLFLPFGIWAALRNRAAWLAGSVYWSLAAVYMLYWVGSWVYGPRYYYEGFYSITLLSAAGVLWLADTGRIQKWIALVLLISLTGYNLIFFLPSRLSVMHGLYGVRRELLAPFLSTQAQELTPALVIVHPRHAWREYGAFTELEDPWLTTPFIFAYSRGEKIDAALADDFPNRRVIHYFMDGRFEPATPAHPLQQE